MKFLISALAAPSLALLMSQAALAEAGTEQPDIASMTCGDFNKLDADGMLVAADNAMMAASDMSDADMKAMQDKMTAMTAEEKAAHMKTAEDGMKKLQTACDGHNEMGLVDAMKASM